MITIATAEATVYVGVGLVAGVVLVIVAQKFSQWWYQGCPPGAGCCDGDRDSPITIETVNDGLWEARNRRHRLPALVVLVRHGESDGNADLELFRTKPDNLVELTSKGMDQANEAGQRIEREIFQLVESQRQRKQQHPFQATSDIGRVHLIVSPFERTLQTAKQLRQWFEHRIVRTEIEPRIREQEFGNLQGDEFQAFRNEQKSVGRFWYRFPTGESGADVYDRVKSWWFESVLCVNERVGYDPVDALVVVTHGLTMRFVLMQLYSWSPTTFHSVWNAGNCDIYVLRKDLTKPGMSPYVLDDTLGDMPQSSIDVLVEFSYGKSQIIKFDDYLSIPPPRMSRLCLVKQRLAQQHPDIDASEIVSVTFMPFTVAVANSNKVVQGRTTSGIMKFKDLKTGCMEQSCRFPNFAANVTTTEDPKATRSRLEPFLKRTIFSFLNRESGAIVCGEDKKEA